jgi:hypothetical protein
MVTVGLEEVEVSSEMDLRCESEICVPNVSAMELKEWRAPRAFA